MRDHLSALPDDILCVILSFVTLRDSVRTRSLSSRWRYLSDYRSVLHFDTLNVLGTKEYHFNSRYQSKYVNAVDQLLEMYEGSKFSALKVEFRLTKQQASHIDRWVESGIRMEIKHLELDFVWHVKRSEAYALSDQQLHSDNKGFNLRCLRLSYCLLTFSPGCASWISLLTTLELRRVTLHEKEMEYIVSGGINLTLLSLFYCCEVTSEIIYIELPCVKKLVIKDCLRAIEINCPRLETLEIGGRVYTLNFLSVSPLTEVKMIIWFPPRNIISCLKRLEIELDAPGGSDLFNIIRWLNASPFLETLHLQLCNRGLIEWGWRRGYAVIPHFRLKEVKIDGFRMLRNALELAQYFVKNAVVVERMVIVDWSLSREEVANTLLEGLKPTTELVIMTPDGVRAVYRKTSYFNCQE